MSLGRILWRSLHSDMSGFVAEMMVLIGGFLAVLWLAMSLLYAMPAHAGNAQTVRIPETSVIYRLRVERATTEFFGLAGSPARLAAQLHQESRWDPQARSAYAWGLAQFTPATAKWLRDAKVCPDLWVFDPWDASQAIRAAACYDRWLYDRVNAATECDRWAMTLSAYNGGLGWVRRDAALARANGARADLWFSHTEAHTSRAHWAREENRGYVRRILLLLEPAYIAAGWPGFAVCASTTP